MRKITETLYEILREAEKILRTSDIYFDGVFVAISNKEGLHGIIGSNDERDLEAIKRICEILGIEIPEGGRYIMGTIHPSSIDYVQQNYGRNTFTPDFLVEHGRRENPHHDGALVFYEENGKITLALATFYVSIPPDRLLREDNGMHGGRYHAARELSKYTGIECCGIIATNDGNRNYTVHVFEDGREVTPNDL
ncbi:MAG: hypothetical protein N3E38_02995 [Candidatus Aenigmarchaeota archaeon]|nr:hypothetical protein [Candidatus Aenigmarchaeota archaeon]